MSGPATTAEWLAAAGIGTGTGTGLLLLLKLALDAAPHEWANRTQRSEPATEQPLAEHARWHSRPAAPDETQPITCVQTTRARHSKEGRPAWT